MKKTIIILGLRGIPVGITIGYLITIFTSFILSNGEYYPCTPSLVNMVGSVIGAVIFQTIMCGVIGFVFASSSIVWSIDEWSIAKQTGIYFLIISFTMLPIAYLTHWMEHSIVGFLMYFGIFISIFIVLWISQYLFWKSRVNKISDKINQKDSL